jgi:hypothetical protein
MNQTYLFHESEELEPVEARLSEVEGELWGRHDFALEDVTRGM